MPRRAAAGSGSIRQRKRGLWEARYTIGKDPATGKQIQHSIYGKTQNEVRQKLQTIISEIDKGTYTERGKDLTVKQWFNIWLKEYTGNVKPDTLNAYKYHTNSHIIKNLGEITLFKLSPHHIQALYNKLQTEDNLSPKTIINLNGVISAALNKAIDLGYISVNPSAKVTLPRVKKAEIQPLNDEEQKKLLKIIHDTPDNCLIITALFTGMRISELIGLTWDCISFDDGSIHINKQLKRNKETKKYYFETPKNGKPRKIMPAKFVIDLLKKQRAEQAAQHIKAADIWDNTFKDLVFTNEIGLHLYPNAIARRFKKYLQQAKIKDHRFHDLRHTFAVNSLRSGNDIKTVQESLGHSTASFTLDMYAHVTTDMMKESAKKMNRYYLKLKRASS